MSFAATQQPGAAAQGFAQAGGPLPPPAHPEGEALREVCPLCGEMLRREQDWCLRCGASARTRLAAPAKWKLLVTTLAMVALLSLGVLIAALVKLAG